MKKRISTFLVGMFFAASAVNAQTIFDPANTEGLTLGAGMEVVTIDGTKYLQVILDGWNSSIEVPRVKTSEMAGFKANFKFSQVSGADIVSYSKENDVKVYVQLNDDVEADQGYYAWGAAESVGELASAINDGFNTYSTSFNNEHFTEFHSIQFAGQSQTDWQPVSGDTMWIGIVEAIPAAATNVIFDPADYVDSTFENMEVVEVGGEKYLKVTTVEDWGPTLEFSASWSSTKYNTITGKMFAVAGENKNVNATAQIMTPSANGTTGIGNFTGKDLSDTPYEIIGDYTPGTEIVAIQFFSQEKENWNAVNGTIIYLGKLTASYVEVENVEAPNTAKIAYVEGAAGEFAPDGLQSEDFWGVIFEDKVDLMDTENGNKVARIATAPADKFTVIDKKTNEVQENTNSYGYWAGAWDQSNLYMWIEAKDDALTNLATLYNITGEDMMPSLVEVNPATWSNDCIEIFVDIANVRTEGHARGTTQYQFRFNYGMQGPAYSVDGNQIIMNYSIFGDGSNDTTNIQYATKEVAGGWALEVAIPWATILRTPSNNNAQALEAIPSTIVNGKKVALEVSLADAEVKDGRNSILNWSNPTGVDTAYTSSEFYGEIELVGGPEGQTAVNETAAASLNVYPNPANDVLYVGLEDVVAVNIYNVAGSLVKAANEAVVNIADLNAGIYVVKATDAAGNTSIAKFVKK